MRKLVGILLVSSYVFGLALVSCEVQSPERVIRRPVIRAFVPVEPHIDALVGDSVLFSVSAIDPNEQVLEFEYRLNGEVVSTEPEWTFLVEDPGDAEVAATASNEMASTGVSWIVTSTVPINEPPSIVDWNPRTPIPSVTAGDPIRFIIVATDPENDELNYAFTAADSIISASNQVTFVADAVGVVRIVGIVTDGVSFDSHAWDLTVLARPDSVMPGQVTITSVERGPEPGELDVAWVAVGGDGDEGIPSDYILRTSSTPIIDQETWLAASDREGEPAPVAPGGTMAMTVRDLTPATFVYVAVRARDEFGNLSDLGNTPGQWVRGLRLGGTVRNAMTTDPVAGLDVSYAGFVATTDAAGRFGFVELPEVIQPIVVRDEPVPVQIGNYYDVQTRPYAVIHEDDLDMWIIPDMPLETTMYPSFLTWVKTITKTNTSQLRILGVWNLPVDIFVPAFVHNGVDYQQVMLTALQGWEAAAGRSVFNLVGAPPTIGIEVDYLGGDGLDNYAVLETDALGLPVRGRVRMRDVYTPQFLQVFTNTAAHEVGHSLGFIHSLDPIHLMVGGQSPPEPAPTQDEVNALRIIYNLGRAHDMDLHRLD